MVKIVVVGNSGSGKTSFVGSLLKFVENFAKVSLGTYHEYLSETTSTMVRKIHSSERLPVQSTHAQLPVLKVKIGNLGSNSEIELDILVQRDEDVFAEESSRNTEVARNADVLWLVFDLTDENTPSFVEVFNRLLAALEIDPRSKLNRKLIVVFTKADRLVNVLPDLIVRYLLNDPYVNISSAKSRDLDSLDLASYLRQVHNISDNLRNYVMRVRDGATFINLALMYGLDLEFCIVSAVRVAPAQSPNFEVHSQRVIDPLLLTLEKSAKSPILDQDVSKSNLSPALQADLFDADTIFLSYKRTDWDAFVKSLVDRMRSRGLSVWVDQHLIEGGDDWQDKIDLALRICSRMVLCVSLEALKSRHVKLEYRYFWNNNKKLFPVICREVELPPILQSIQYFQYSRVDDLIELLSDESRTGTDDLL